MAGSVSFTISALDYYQAQRSHHLRTLRSGALWRRSALYGATTFAVVTLYVTMVNEDRWLVGVISGVIALVLGALLVALAYAIGFATLRRRSATLYDQHAALKAPFTFAWDDQGDHWVGATTEGRTPWRDYFGWAESDTMVLLYLTDLLYQMVPKRALDPAALADLRATLDAHGPPRR